MQKLVSLLFLVMFALSGMAMASESADGDKAMTQEDPTAKCTAAGNDSGLQGDELNAYIESCLQQSTTTSSGEGKQAD